MLSAKWAKELGLISTLVTFTWYYKVWSACLYLYGGFQ